MNHIMASSSSGLHTPDFRNQLRYMLEWFMNFSQLQKGDFLPVLVEQFSSERRLNGLPPIHSDEAPSEAPLPSIFQCRVKLIIQWTSNWTHPQKWEFINAIRVMDPDFVSDFLSECNFEPLPAEEN